MTRKQCMTCGKVITERFWLCNHCENNPEIGYKKGHLWREQPEYLQYLMSVYGKEIYAISRDNERVDYIEEMYEDPYKGISRRTLA